MQFLAWPIVALVLGITTIFVFKTPLARFIDRAKKIGAGSLQVATNDQTSGVEAKPSPADELLKEFDNTILLEKEEQIREELEKFGVKSGADRERVLMRYLAALLIVQIFDQIYRLIWGSQISMLQFLNSAGSIQLSLLHPWYAHAKAKNIELYNGYTFEQWLGFLQSKSLIVLSGKQISITLAGREFLKYLLHQGYTLYKSG